jgi:response regulator RpfG family c-di-GMP phosphodiesterase
MSALEDLTLWSVLKEKGTDEQRTMVRRLVDEASSVLADVIETFPTYTLHDATHSANVAKMMGRLLGPALHQLSPLEAAMLILSSWWHDIGMVFTPEERNALAGEPHWPEFLAEHPEAEVMYAEAG